MRLLTRTTRSVALTEDGACLLDEARALLFQADSLAARFRTRGRYQTATLRVGAIDSAAAGLLPLLLHDFRERHPEIVVQLVEDKTIRLLPRLLSGRLDLAFVRPPESPDKRPSSCSSSTRRSWWPFRPGPAGAPRTAGDRGSGRPAPDRS